ncbi:MAG: hypothetical protein ACI9KE_002301 [Polyangiales bacterium]|jgi:hypothetical protein
MVADARQLRIELERHDVSVGYDEVIGRAHGSSRLARECVMPFATGSRMRNASQHASLFMCFGGNRSWVLPSPRRSLDIAPMGRHARYRRVTCVLKPEGRYFDLGRWSRPCDAARRGLASVTYEGLEAGSGLSTL